MSPHIGISRETHPRNVVENRATKNRFPLVARNGRATSKIDRCDVSGCRSALGDGAGVHLAGGTHHAFPGRGEGFCVFNDVAVSIRVLQAEAKLQRAVVIDLDVHQGNGTAAIFADDSSVFTFSMHGERNFPVVKRGSDLDIELPDGTTDGDYLARLKSIE